MVRRTSLHDKADEELVQLARQDPHGEVGQSAASELFERYQERVYLWCLRRVQNHDRALDLAQDVMLSAYRSLANFQGRSLYSSWLFAIARNRCFRALRRPRLLWDEDAELEGLADSSPSADRLVEDQQEEQLVLRLMREVLDPQEQTALWLRCAEQLPVEEITRRLQLTSSSGARGLLQTARRKLRAAMVAEGRA